MNVRYPIKDVALFAQQISNLEQEMIKRFDVRFSEKELSHVQILVKNVKINLKTLQKDAIGFVSSYRIYTTFTVLVSSNHNNFDFEASGIYDMVFNTSDNLLTLEYLKNRAKLKSVSNAMQNLISQIGVL